VVVIVAILPLALLPLSPYMTHRNIVSFERQKEREIKARKQYKNAGFCEKEKYTMSNGMGLAVLIYKQMKMSKTFV
jgi:hypothetical protein